jgi:hypothetical protein
VEYNFARLPVVHSREPLWDEPDAIIGAAQGEPEPMHMPPPSAWPVFTAFGIVLTFGLFMTQIWWAPLIGLAVTAIGVINWAFEPIH